MSKCEGVIEETLNVMSVEDSNWERIRRIIRNCMIFYGDPINPRRLRLEAPKSQDIEYIPTDEDSEEERKLDIEYVDFSWMER